MTVGTDTTDEEIDASGFFNHLFVVRTFCFEVFSVSVEDVNVFFRAVNVVEEVGRHEGVIAFGVRLGQSHVFVHVESEHVLEAHASFLVGFHQCFIHSDGGGAGGETQHKRFLSGGVGFVDAVNHIVGSPLGELVVVRLNDYSLVCLILMVIRYGV